MQDYLFVTKNCRMYVFLYMNDILVVEYVRDLLLVKEVGSSPKSKSDSWPGCNWYNSF